ncbi:unnamed protein product [Victoria cruziana]
MAAVAVPRSMSLSSTSSSDSDIFYRRSGRREMTTPQETPYPVVVFDGEQNVDAGHIGIHSGTQFKALKVALSQKTGVPPKQISAALVCRRGLMSSEKRRQKKLPINENTNFAGILAQHNPRTEKDCFLLVTARKSRRSRERRARSRRNVVGDDGDGSASSRDEPSPPGKPHPARSAVPEKAVPGRDPPPMPAAGIPDLSSVRIYPPAMNGILGAMQDTGMVIGPFGTRKLPAYDYVFPCAYTAAYTLWPRRVRITICETCSEAGDGREVAFHPCVFDEVLEVWRRSPSAGPIQRPSKPGRVEAAA